MKFWKLLPTLFSKNCKTKFKSEISPWKMAIFDTVFDDFWQFLTLKILVTKFSKIRILAVQIWTSFPEIGLCHAPENWNFGKTSGWVFQDLSISVNHYPDYLLKFWYFRHANYGENGRVGTINYINFWRELIQFWFDFRPIAFKC